MKGRPARIWAFRALALALPLLGLLSAELLLRTIGSEFDPFIAVENETTIFSHREIDGVAYIEVSHPEAYAARNTRFPVEKPPNTRRIFSFGGSASASWPHRDDELYSEYLRFALERAYPDHAIEVINLGAHAFASYRVRMIFDDVIGYDPDLVILYSGNNDFLEKRSYLVDSSLLRALERLGQRSRLVQFVSHGLRSADTPDNTIDGRSAWGHHQSAVWDWVRQVSTELRADPQQFERVVQHYAYSIRHMTQSAAAHEVPALLLTVPSNLRDWKPNASHNRLTGPQLTEWEALYRRGRSALLEGEFSAAVAHFDEALALESLHAESHYYRARALEAAGQLDRARVDYIAAKDLDYSPFRAISEFNNRVRKIAKADPNVTLVDAEAAFAANSSSPAGVPGFDLFLDYVHPTRMGNLLLARLIFDLVVGDDLLEIEATTPQFNSPPESRYDEDRYAPMQIVLLWILGMNRQEEAMLAKAQALGEVAESGGFPDATPDEVAQLTNFVAEVEAAVGPYVALRERSLRGGVTPALEREKIMRRVNAFYARHYGDAKRPWTRTPSNAP